MKKKNMRIVTKKNEEKVVGFRFGLDLEKLNVKLNKNHYPTSLLLLN